MLDVGTGSGAIALAIADELPGPAVVGIDSSAEAIAVARGNAKRLGYEGRVTFEQADLSSFSRIPGGSRQDLVVANLPYVAESDWETLQPEIRDYEPREALIAGPGRPRGNPRPPRFTPSMPCDRAGGRDWPGRRG